jgi:hypothetical protein
VKIVEREWMLGKQPMNTEDLIENVCSDIQEMLIQKNRAYGDSALDPVRVFSKSDPVEQIYVRIDDKLSRVKRGHEYPGDDTIKDLVGYLILLLVAKEKQNGS